jgi:hypothetical protein
VERRHIGQESAVIHCLLLHSRLYRQSLDCTLFLSPILHQNDMKDSLMPALDSEVEAAKDDANRISIL